MKMSQTLQRKNRKIVYFYFYKPHLWDFFVSFLFIVTFFFLFVAFFSFCCVFFLSFFFFSSAAYTQNMHGKQYPTDALNRPTPIIPQLWLMAKSSGVLRNRRKRCWRGANKMKMALSGEKVSIWSFGVVFVRDRRNKTTANKL